MDDAVKHKTTRALSGLCISAAFAATCVFTLIDPIAQDPSYHAFADQRRLFGVPHFGDVVSNLAFLLAAAGGLRVVWSIRLPWGQVLPYAVFFLAIGLVGAGSACYHWQPDNERLVWDRVPMALAFMSLFSLVIMERIHPAFGTHWALLGLTALGVASVFYWHVTERVGQGDLRFYGLVQFYPLLAIPVICAFSPRQTGLGGRYLLGLLSCYVLAKAFEHFDHAVYLLTNQLISGHTLKHLLAALGCCFLLEPLKSYRVARTSTQGGERLIRS